MKNIMIVGAGGLGGTIAALLARKNTCRLTLVGRPGIHIKAIQRNGLRLQGREEFTVQVHAIDDTRDVRNCDVLIYAVKAQDTELALRSTSHILINDFAASVQNGVTKDEMLARAFGIEKVLGAVAIVAGERLGPGVVNWTYDGGTQFGELDGQASARGNDIVDIFQQAGFIAQSSDAIVSCTWSKMAGWIPLGLIAALCRHTNARILSNTQLAAQYVGMVRELNNLAVAKGIPLVDIGPYHVHTWCEGTFKEAIASVMTSPLANSQSTHSALQDILKGHTTEFSACVGSTINEAIDKSITVNAIQLMYATLMGLEETIKGVQKDR